MKKFAITTCLVFCAMSALAADKVPPVQLDCAKLAYAGVKVQEVRVAPTGSQRKPMTLGEYLALPQGSNAEVQFYMQSAAQLVFDLPETSSAEQVKTAVGKFCLEVNQYARQKAQGQSTRP